MRNAELVDPVREEPFPDQGALPCDGVDGALSLRFAPRGFYALRLTV
ncbi:MAG: hypothetical protein M0Z66_08650 [Thermaerobacter sp.]|nr:hypothetical protein [Thermaerobacter sp.]